MSPLSARTRVTHDVIRGHKSSRSPKATFGFTNPVLTGDDLGILAGHGRVAAAQLIGMKAVPTVRLSDLSPAERKPYIVADNKLALNAAWDREVLAIELQGLIDLGFDVETTG